MTEDRYATASTPASGSRDGLGLTGVTCRELLLTMLAAPAASGLARTLAAERLRSWGHHHVIDDATLIIGELIANAVRETPGREIRFQFSRDVHGLLIAVWDSSPRMPRPRPVVEVTLDDLDVSEDSLDRNGGWGLPIVQALSATCGCTRDPLGGKWTWSRLSPGRAPARM